MNKSVQIM